MFLLWGTRMALLSCKTGLMLAGRSGIAADLSTAPRHAFLVPPYSQCKSLIYGGERTTYASLSRKHRLPSHLPPSLDGIHPPQEPVCFHQNTNRSVKTKRRRPSYDRYTNDPRSPRRSSTGRSDTRQ